MKNAKGFLIGIPIAGFVFWIGMARTWKDFLMIALTLYAVIVTLLLISARKKMVLAYKYADPFVVKNIQTKNVELQDELTKMAKEKGHIEGQLEQAQSLNSYYAKKFKQSDGAKMDEETGRFYSEDGISRNDKDHLAYQWSEEGIPVTDIAERLRIAPQSVRAYINRGKDHRAFIDGQMVKYRLTDENKVISYVEQVAE